ncbi:AE binding protein 2 jing isoform X2 [Haemaphysalis longicornis]
MMCLDESDGMLFKGRKGLAPGDVTGDAAVFEAGSLFNYVATSSGESCRSSSDSASSAPCSPESVLSDSGGVEGLPDSVAGLVSGDLVDLDDAVVAASDPGFNLSRLLLPQQHRQGESAAEARKRDLRLVDEVVAAATASAATVAPPSVDPPSPPASACPKLSASAATLLSSSSITAATSATTSSPTPPSTTSPSTSTAVLVVSPAVSSVLSVPSPAACSGTVSSSQAALCVTAPSTCRQAVPLVSPTCVPLLAPTASVPHSGGCAKSRRPRRLSDGGKKRDNTATSGSQHSGPEDDEAEDEDICRRREAEVASLLRHCINLVADRLDPQHITQRNHHRDQQAPQEEAHSHRESRQRDHQQATGALSSPRSHRHQEHQPHSHQHKESHHQERHHQDTNDSEEPSSSEQHRNHLVTLEPEGRHHSELDSHPSPQKQQQHHKRPHLRQQQQATSACLPSSPDDNIPEDDATRCLLTATPSTSSTLTTVASLSTVHATVASEPGTSSSFLAAPSPSAPSVADDGLLACRWLDCEMRLRGEEALGDHVRVAHVDTQTRDQGVYLCRWQGCKVFERRSCSRQWLERHVTLSHCGSKPFACIVAGCGQRFGSQGALQRHVNAHFERSLNGSGPVPFGAGAGSGSSGSGVASGGSLLGSRGFGSKELANGESPLKLLRLRKKLKCRRRAWATAKHADFFDAGVMEELRHRLADVSAPQTPTEPHSWNGSTVTFHGTVVAKRKENTGKVKVLLHWTPEHILPDSWVAEDQPTEKVVALSSLSADDLDTLNLWPKDLQSLSRSSGRRRKRK